MKRSADGALVQSAGDGRRKMQVVSGGKGSGSRYGAVVRARTSDLEAPVMHLQGHESEVLTMRFSPLGNTLASAGTDKLIFIWNVYGHCQNLHRFKGHTNAITELQWNTSGDRLYTSSADCTVCIWDVPGMTRIKKIKHAEIVNCCAVSKRGDPLLVAGGDDGFARLWDTRAPKNVAQSYEGAFPVTSVDIAAGGDLVYAGDAAGEVQVWESRKEKVLYTLRGHTDVVTGLRISPDGTHLLSNAADNTLRQWDIRPFVAGGDNARCTRVLYGHKHGADKNLLRCAWHPSGSYVSSGSSDMPPSHFIWNAITEQVVYQLPGHKAAINDVDFHPQGSIFGSCSSDKTIYLGEMQEG